MATLKQLKMRITVNGMFPGMKRFKVHGKELKNLPKSLFNLLDLEVLDLSPERETCLFFRLTKLPKEICQLSLLKVLILDTNQIRILPDEICLLRGLERLTLSNNLLDSLPEKFYNLTSLCSLHCANNKFQGIPDVVLHLPELVFLDFSDNQITIIPDRINELKKLESLILNYNRVTSIPQTICDLQQLQILWLSGNNITALPTSFGKLVKLDWTRWCTSSALDGNPLQNPPLHIAKQGPKAIENYFRNRKEKTTAQT